VPVDGEEEGRVGDFTMRQVHQVESQEIPPSKIWSAIVTKANRVRSLPPMRGVGADIFWLTVLLVYQRSIDSTEDGKRMAS
jgi:hypothetical protein